LPLPFIVSRYLRPFVAAGGELLYDNGVTGRVERLSALEDALIRSLWTSSDCEPDAAPDDAAEAKLAALLAQHGASAVKDALLGLYGRALVFESRAAGDALFRELRAGRCPDVPFVDQIELTNRCPMRCGFCPRGVPGKMVRPTGFMELALFKRLLAQLPPEQASYRPLELHHLGESLLHPQVVEFVAAASAHGLPTEMSVNPSLLTPELGQRLIAAGLGRLVLSLDGTDDQTLVQLRGPAARYSKAERNIAALMQEVRRRGDAAPHVVIQMIALAGNRHQHAEFLRRFGPLHAELPTVQAYIKPLDGDDPTQELASPQAGQPAAAQNRLQYLCSYPFRSVVVLWDGRVVPCCRDDDAHHVLGDLRTQTLAEIWNGDSARELRRRHRSGQFPEGHLCAGCAWSPAAFTQESAHCSRHPDRAAPAPLQW